MPQTITVDTATLPPDHIQTLQQLVEAAAFFHLPETPPPSKQRDRFEYVVTIQKGDQSHTITFSETTVPESLTPLMRWLMAL